MDVECFDTSADEVMAVQGRAGPYGRAPAGCCVTDLCRYGIDNSNNNTFSSVCSYQDDPQKELPMSPPSTRREVIFSNAFHLSISISFFLSFTFFQI